MTRKQKVQLAKTSKEDELAHPGMTKYGEHWYSNKAIIIHPIDLFADSFNQSVDEIQWGLEEAEYLGFETIDFFEIIYYIFAGFFDLGDSWELLMAVMKHNGMYKWLSEKTKFLIPALEYRLVHRQWKSFFWVIKEYLVERFYNAGGRGTVMGLFRLFEISFEFFIILIAEEDGKMSIFNRTFTSFITIFIGWIVIILQWIFEIWPSNYWLRGNFLVIFDHIFAGVQFVLGAMLLMDFQFYDYTLILIRKLSFLTALVYNLIYILNLGLAYDLLYIQDQWRQDDSQALPDFILASMSGYSVVQFSFTAFFNQVIINKEMTMNQFAFSKNEDYKSGEIHWLNWNVDLLYWFGIDSNVEDYWELAREFSRTYL